MKCADRTSMRKIERMHQNQHDELSWKEDEYAMQVSCVISSDDREKDHYREYRSSFVKSTQLEEEVGRDEGA